MKPFNFHFVDKKWQKVWDKDKIHVVRDRVKDKKNFMLLVEFPYPSGNLHIGHWYAFAVPDILARYLRMRGKNVMYPIGFDAFGLPAENAAIKRKINPRDWTESNIRYMTGQLKSMGASFDWSRVVSTIDPKYYKWTQWLFLKMYRKGLAYRAKTSVNWCPKDKTVLANEQVINGKCERCGTTVAQKEIEQWLFKITKYADRLIDDIENLNWPRTTKLAQKNWIGRSNGTSVKFKIESRKSEIGEIEVFTTRIDTIFGCTYIVVAPEHKILRDRGKGMGASIKNWDEIKKYIAKAKKKSVLQRTEDKKDKTGVEIKGIKAVNLFTGEKIPVFVADYVLASYGTGAVMAVPAHDERDLIFAAKYKLPVRQVIFGQIGGDRSTNLRRKSDKLFTEDGILRNSGKFSRLKSEEARTEMTQWLKKNNLGGPRITYKLHDWVLSRQRYWGVPIPMIHCNRCKYVPVSENDLPVKLPPLKNFIPTDEGKSPLAKAKEWMKVKCPRCGNMAERETDTMDTFVDSSWYFIRYADLKNNKKFADPKKMKEWLPVPMYIGGAEHNTMHLLYSRFFIKALHDLRLVSFNEPFTERRNHGTILGPDSRKMSKSKGNVVDPDKEVEKFGADSVRMYLAFMGPYDQGGPWQLNGIIGIYRFLEKILALKSKITSHKSKVKIEHEGLDRFVHKTVKKVGDDIQELRFNTAISALMILVNEMGRSSEVSRNVFETFLKILAPFAPHFSEEIWRTKLGHKRSIHLENWPQYDKKLITEEKVTIAVQINGKTRGTVIAAKRAVKEDILKIVGTDAKLAGYIQGQEIRKVIFVPDKIINILI